MTPSWMSLQFDQRGWYRYYMGCDVSESFEYFHRLQNPSNCDNAKYFLTISHNWGHGSSFHMVSDLFSCALRFNRIMVYDNDWIWSQKMCNKQNMDCYFAPITNCTYSSDIVWKSYEDDHALESDDHEKYVSSQNFGYCGEPSSFYNQNDKCLDENVYKRYHNSKKTMYYGSALRYMLRPNVEFYKDMMHMMDTSLVVLRPDAPKPILVVKNNIPFPEHAIGIHIRHGDKWTESKLFNYTEYMNAADQLREKFPYLSKSIILGTDDEHIIENIENNPSERRGYTFYYTLFTRLNDGGSPMATAMQTSNVKVFTVHAMLNLMLITHPAISGYVQSTMSNWNRLIRELVNTDCVLKDRHVIDLNEK